MKVGLAIAWLENKIIEIQNNPNLTTEQKERIILFYRRCLRRVKWQWVELKFNDNQFHEVRNEFSINDENDAKLSIYTSHILEEQYSAAEPYLISINNEEDEVLSDFVTIQIINLNRITTNEFLPTQQELNTVENIARKRHVYSGYAKALHYWLTGELISSDLPSLFNNSNFRSRSEESKKYVDVVEIYPNPIEDVLNTESSNGNLQEIVILNSNGQEVFKEVFQNKSRILTSDWSKGIYFITIFENSVMKHNEKIIIID